MFKHVIKEETKVPADIRYLGEMRDFITKVGRKYGVGERNINAFKLAIDEAATNIIRHAYRDWDGFITLRMIIRDRNVTISMIDQGHAFDPRLVKDPDLNRYVQIGKKGGLGIFIIRRVIDQIDYRKTPEGNELRLTKNRIIKPKVNLSVPNFGVSIKARFSLVACGVLATVIISVFLWHFFRIQHTTLEENIAEGRVLVKLLSRNSVDFLARETGPDTPELARIAAEVQRDNAPWVVEALIVDNTNTIAGAYVMLDRILEPFAMPSGARSVARDVFSYRLPNGQKVYDVVEKAVPEGGMVPVGTVHLYLNQDVIREQIVQARKNVAIYYSGILVLACLGVFIIIYITMSPFKKLVMWIRALGRDEVQDDVQFDSSTEVGEIAQAFSEITEKFRKSQANLAEQERLQKEMQVAQEIQHTLLPDHFPTVQGYEIASYYDAAKEVGGDYFDFVDVDKDSTGIVVADVSGKGVPGSLVMTMIRTALRTEARGNKDPADVLARVNDFVMNDMKRGMFVTVFYIILDSHNRTIHYASAGHNPMILYRSKTEKSYYLNPRGFPIGINLPEKGLFRKSIHSDSLQLQEGDVLIAYTDGVTEAMNPEREHFGEERFLSVIRKYGAFEAQPLVDKIRDNINAFTEGCDQNDDITLVAIREKMSKEEALYSLRSRLLHLVKSEQMTVKDACKTVGVSTSTYYKYKKRYDKEGDKGLRVRYVKAEIEEKHISIEDKAKIFDIIKNNPELGAKRISEELNAEKYGFTVIDEKRIYDELVKSRLNTYELRLAFIEKGDKGKRMKPPGTPLLTLNGDVVVQRRQKPAPYIPAKQAAAYQEEEEEEFESRSKKRRKDRMAGEDLFLDDMTRKTRGKMAIQSDTPEKDEFAILDELTASDDDPGHRFHGYSQETKSGKEENDFADTDHPEADREETKTRDDLFEEMMVDFVDVSADEPHREEGDDVVSGIIDGGGETGEEFDFGDNIESHISSTIGGELFEQEMDLFSRISEDEDTPDDNGNREAAFLNGVGDIGLHGQKGLQQREFHMGNANRTGDMAQAVKRHLDSGLWFYRNGQYNKAIQKFYQALETNPKNPEAYQYLGDTYFRMGQLGKAKDAYEKVRQLDPDNLNVMENLGVIFANRGDYKKAVWQWGEVLKHNPDRRDIIDRIKKMQRVIRQRSLS